MPAPAGTSRARLLVLATVAIWSFGTLLGRLISHRAPYLLLNLSFLCSAAVFLPYVARRGRAALRAALRPRHLAFGLFGYLLYSTPLMLSFRAYGRATEPTVLNYTWPVFTVLLTGLFGRRRAAPAAVRRIEAAGLLAGFAAVALLAGGGEPGGFDFANLPGLLSGLAAGLGYGLYSAYSGTVPAEEHGSFLLASALGSAVAMLPLSAGDLADLPRVAPAEWLAAAALGALVNGLGYACWTRANALARETGESIAAVAGLTFLLPFLSLAVIALFLGESRFLEPRVAASACVIAASSILCQKAEAIAAYLGMSRGA